MAKKARRPATRAKSPKAAKIATPAKTARKSIAKRAAPRRVAAPQQKKASDVPSLFRLNIEVGNLDEAATFYGTLLGLEPRRQAGSRCYFTCGSVTLQVVDVSSAGTPHPAAKALYFVVKDLEAIHSRASALKALSRDDVHGAGGGAISVRPWGERSFYAEDKWANPLCFVEEGTIYPG
jgi:catechol 2,3-dioxygenase-like lactoylglutathione lyase family enzyme